MSFIELPLEDVQEDELVPEGRYELQITSAKEKLKEETGRTSILVALQILNPPSEVENPATVFQYLALPLEGDEPNTRKMFMLQIRRFLELFQIPYENGFNYLDFPGATAECLLKIEEYEGNEKNVLVIPKIEK